jgi:VIT1/CCC1 family predicted Fe2+/Mn2+ transporter
MTAKGEDSAEPSEPVPEHPSGKNSVEGFSRHYIRDIVYAASDGLVTTFAVVAGVWGAGLSSGTVLALGFANLLADGLSMAIGDYLGIKSERATELGDAYEERAETIHAARHGGVTWLSFFAAGLVPLLPFLLGQSLDKAIMVSLVLTAVTQFTVGALRSRVTGRGWLRSGLEMLFVGSIAGAAAFGAGLVVKRMLAGDVG